MDWCDLTSYICTLKKNFNYVPLMKPDQELQVQK